MPDGIKRPVRVEYDEEDSGYRYPFCLADAQGATIATFGEGVSPEDAEAIAAALNAADPRAALQAMTDVEGPTAEEAVEDCRAAQRALGDFATADPHGLWLRCSCGHDIDVLQAVVDNSAAEVEEDGKRRFQGVGALVTFLKCPACGKRTALGYEEVTGEVTVTDPRGREVHIPVRSGDSVQDDEPTDAAINNANPSATPDGGVWTVRRVGPGFTFDPPLPQGLILPLAATLLQTALQAGLYGEAAVQAFLDAQIDNDLTDAEMHEA
jgi:hypothetical protein